MVLGINAKTLARVSSPSTLTPPTSQPHRELTLCSLFSTHTGLLSVSQSCYITPHHRAFAPVRLSEWNALFPSLLG